MRENIVTYPTEFLFRLMGVWPGSSYPMIRRIFWVTLLVIVQRFQYWNVISHVGTKYLVDLIGGFVLAVTDTIVLNRVFFLCLNTRVIHDVFDAMSEDWNEETCTQWQLETMIKKASLANRCGNGLMTCYFFGAIIIGCGILGSEYRRQNTTDVNEEHIFLKTHYPLESKYSPMKEILIIEQFVQQVFIIILSSSAVTLLISLVHNKALHVDGQIDIIRKQLSDITLKKEKPGYIRKCLKMVIRRHQRVINFCDNIEKIFTYMAFMVFLVMAVLFGSIWFILSVSSDVILQVLFVVYYTCFLLDVLVYCIIGEYLRGKSLAVGQASYETVWYEFNSDECQMLLLLLLRSQKSLTITVGKFVDLSMELFASTIKTSVSIVSLFLAVY